MATEPQPPIPPQTTASPTDKTMSGPGTQASPESGASMESQQYETYLSDLLADTGSLEATAATRDPSHSMPSDAELLETAKLVWSRTTAASQRKPPPPTETVVNSPVREFMLRRDRLAVHPNFADALIQHYEIETFEHLTEIVHAYSPKEAITMLDTFFSLDAFPTMKESLVNLVLFGKYLENTYELERVPPLDQL